VMIELTFLGTSSMVPTPERNHSAILLTFKGESMLVDCGESTQKQLKIAKVKPTKIRKILISHLHGDHVLGLPGLMQTLSASDYEGTLSIYGPTGISRFMENMLVTFAFDNKLEYRVYEISEGVFFDGPDYSLEAVGLEHSLPCFGFSFVEKDKRRIKLQYVKAKGIPDGPLLGDLQNGKEIVWKGDKISPKDATYIVKGKKVSFINDTVYCNGCDKLARGSDVLVSESTYTDLFKEKAREHMHLTARQAAEIASRNDVGELILTHFSQRFKTTDEVLLEAKEIFPNVSCAFDFMKKKI